MFAVILADFKDKLDQGLSTFHVPTSESFSVPITYVFSFLQVKVSIPSV